MDAWGKFDGGRIHRLEHHCADVAACFEALLREPVLRARFARAAAPAVFTDVTAARLAYLAFLHDFGKVNALFQAIARPDKREKAGHTGEALLCFESPDMAERLGLVELEREWGTAVEPLLRAALAHHGRPARRRPPSGSGKAALWAPTDDYDPRTAAELLRARGHAWFPDAFADGPKLPDTAALAHLFAGIVTLADQLGSDEEFFKYESEPDPDYMAHARRTATKAIRSRNFERAGWANGAAPTSFQGLFGHPAPRPAQEAAAAAPLDATLLIIESETGSGKTEAAVLRFAALWRAGLVDGLYFAVPTRAAAKQLHGRIGKALKNLLPKDAHVQTTLAVPGYLKAGEAEGRRVGRFGTDWTDEAEEEELRARWSAESARKFLSSAAAVGTVDQVLLAGLKVKWAHFRGASLSRSLLVVDEVHASDAYMTTVLEGVLAGHAALGGHAMLMSATLGAEASAKLAAAAGGQKRREETKTRTPQAAMKTPYPALTVAGGGGEPKTQEIVTDESEKPVAMKTEPWLQNGAAGAVARAALAAAQAGARVLVIRNAVPSAQAVFEAALQEDAGETLLKVEGVATLHHGRFAVEDRRLLDDAVERTLGAGGKRAGGAVVVGTQTLEQSLDIDADLLITDICPADVLLQRIGRLHRHRRNDRPSGFTEPRCIVLVPEDDLETGLNGGLLRHGLGSSRNGNGIYENLVCIKATQRLITERGTWNIPAMNRELVERATHPEILDDLAETLGEAWKRHGREVRGRYAAVGGIGRQNALDRTQEFGEELVFIDDDEKIRTRLGDDGPRVVLTEPALGPFGRAVETFNLPRHIFKGQAPTADEIASARAELGHAEGTLLIQIGDCTLMYDRTGIRRTG